MLDLPDYEKLCTYCNSIEIAEVIECEIISLNERYPNARFSFAHIVLDDYNLFDGHIRYCLQQRVINRWFDNALSQCEPSACNPNSSNSWERWQYDELTELRDATIEFLRWLLSIPEHIREMVDDAD